MIGSEKMALSLVRLGIRAAVMNLERSAAVLSNASAQKQIKVSLIKQ